MWNISGNQVQYRVLHFIASYPPGRMTRVGIAYPTEGRKSPVLKIRPRLRVSRSGFVQARLFRRVYTWACSLGCLRIASIFCGRRAWSETEGSGRSWESVAEALRDTFIKHRHEAECSVKIHLLRC